MSEQPVDVVWFFSGDLMFASRVQGAAQQAGLAFAILGNWPEDDRPSPAWVIVDLATRGKAASEIQRRAALVGGVRTIAYGPHVMPDKLAEARRQGFDTVMTRGQFDAALPTLFRP